MSSPLRRLLLVPLALLFLIGLAGAGLYAARTDLVQWLAARQLAEFGLPEARLTVEEVAWNRARLSGLSAGREGELRLDQAVLRYQLPRLLGGKLEEVNLKGLFLRLDLTGDGPPLGSLQAPLEALFDGTGSGATVDPAEAPLVTLEAGEIGVRSAFGPARLIVEGRAAPEAGGIVAANLGLALSAARGKLLGRLTARAEADGAITGGLRVDQGALSLGEEDLSARVLAGGLRFAWREDAFESLEGQLAFDDILLRGAALGAAAFTINATPARFAADGKIGPADGAFDLRVRTEVDDYATAPQIDSELALSTAAGAALWRFLPEPHPEAGKLDLALTARGRLPGGAPAKSTPEALWSWLSDADLAGDLSLGLEAVKLPGLADSIDANLPASLVLEQGQLTAAGDASTTLAGLSPTLLEALGLPPSWLGKNVSLALGGAEDALFTARLGAEGLALEGSALLSAPEHLDLSATGRAALAFDPAFRASHLSTEVLKLTATAQALAGTPVRSLELQGDLSGKLDLASDAGAGFAHDLILHGGTLDLALERNGAAPLTVKAGQAALALAGDLTPAGLYSGEASLTAANLVLPELALALDGISAKLPIADGAVAGGIALAASALRDLEDPPRFHPVQANGRLQPGGQALDFRATLSGAGGAGRVELTGQQSLDGSDAGEARAVLTPIDFQPGSIQPAALSPLLDGLNEVSGQVGAEAHFTWGAKGLDSTASLASEALSFESGGVTFTGLKGALTLDRLDPLSSPPGQTLSAAGIDPGVPLNDIEVRYQLLPGDPVLARVEAATFSSLGGDYRVGEALIDPTAPRQEILLEVIDLDLAELFEEIEIEGLSGTGNLAGTLPLTVGPEGVALTKGLLKSNGKGVLRFHSPAAAEALKSGGQPVELMLQALEDFHYGRLVLRANKQADGETDLRIKLKGKNPALLDGQRFNFNINLTGNLGPVLTALSQGRALSNKLLGGAWKLE